MSNDTTNLRPERAMARLARVPANWLRAEAEAGRIPHLKAGVRLLFHVPTVLRILAERAATGMSLEPGSDSKGKATDPVDREEPTA